MVAQLPGRAAEIFYLQMLTCLLLLYGYKWSRENIRDMLCRKYNYQGKEALLLNFSRFLEGGPSHNYWLLLTSVPILNLNFKQDFGSEQMKYRKLLSCNSAIQPYLLRYKVVGSQSGFSVVSGFLSQRVAANS